MFYNMMRTSAAMMAIWVLGVLALWMAPHNEAGQRIGQSNEPAMVYSVQADASFIYQDQSAEFTVPVRSTRPTVIF